MDEEKTIDEAVEEQAIDEAVEEQADEMKEFEPVAFDEVIKETEPERKDAPILRALGDPDPADMNMIHKHLDNFLAMLCGETPIDDNVRTSTEYWLKRLADGLGGSTKKIYAHMITLVFTNGDIRTGIVLNSEKTAFTKTTFIQWLSDLRTSTNEVRIPFSGSVTINETTYPVAYLYSDSNTPVRMYASTILYASYSSFSGFFNDITTFFDNILSIN